MYRPMLLLTTLVTLACTEGSVSPLAPTNSRLVFRSSETSSVPLVEHLISPQATDPAIDQFLDTHDAYLDPTAQGKHRLLLFMAGTGQRPQQFLFIQKEAARLGYHVVGLMIPNTGGFARFCPPLPDPAKCYEDVRLELLDGIDRSSLLNVSAANSIDNRFIKLLHFLAANYPDEGWSQFFNDQGPKWPLIAVGGLSLGGGEAAMIAKIRLVDRVLLLSAAPDSVGKEPAPWEEGHATPTNRYFGLAHNRDGLFIPMVKGWGLMGLGVFGDAVLVEGSEPPYGGSHMLVTGLTPQGGFVGQNAHGSTGTDSFTPLAADGVPLLLDAWRYMLSALPKHSGN